LSSPMELAFLSTVSDRMPSTSLMRARLRCFSFCSCALLFWPKAGGIDRRQKNSTTSTPLPANILPGYIKGELQFLVFNFRFTVFKDNCCINKASGCFVQQVDSSVIREYLVANQLEVRIVDCERIVGITLP